MIVNLGQPGTEQPSELILDFVEDVRGGDPEFGNSSPLLYDAARELHDACESVARDTILNPTCHEPEVHEWSAMERQRRAALLACVLHAEYLRDIDTQTVTLRAWCGTACLLRARAIADPGQLVICNTYPVVMQNFRDSRS